MEVPVIFPFRYHERPLFRQGALYFTQCCLSYMIYKNCARFVHKMLLLLQTGINIRNSKNEKIAITYISITNS